MTEKTFTPARIAAAWAMLSPASKARIRRLVPSPSPETRDSPERRSRIEFVLKTASFVDGPDDDHPMPIDALSPGSRAAMEPRLIATIAEAMERIEANDPGSPGSTPWPPEGGTTVHEVGLSSLLPRSTPAWVLTLLRGLLAVPLIWLAVWAAYFVMYGFAAIVGLFAHALVNGSILGYGG